MRIEIEQVLSAALVVDARVSGVIEGDPRGTRLGARTRSTSRLPQRCRPAARCQRLRRVVKLFSKGDGA